MENTKIPNHVALIVDGNGRWAKERGLSRSKGHERGFENLKTLLKHIYQKNVSIVSAYLFSTENFNRSQTEINFIMNLLTDKINEIINLCHEGQIKAIISGRNDKLSDKVQKTLKKLTEETKTYENKTLNICFNYGSHAEIIDATKKIANDIINKKININDITENNYEQYLYQTLPPVDLLIRTSGEQRLSNFMLWQCAYAEFYFPKTYFPDFDAQEFDKALIEYNQRDRRFGGINNEK